MVQNIGNGVRGCIRSCYNSKVALTKKMFNNFCSVIDAGDTLTITYDLRNGWPVVTDIVLIHLFDCSWILFEVTIWKLNTPSDGINHSYGIPPLFYAPPVLACTDEIFCNLETTKVETRSLRPTRVHETWKCQIYHKRKSILQETSQSKISESYFCARSNDGKSSITSPSRIISAPPPKLQRIKK